MSGSFTRWLRISLFNLLLTAAIGVTLRYKIIFSLRWVDQGYLLHGHSHFAFAGWVTQVLMSLMVRHLEDNGQVSAFKKYNWLLYANLFTAYGMLISFPLEGYTLFSIIFSTLSIFVSYAFAIIYSKDLKRIAVKNSSGYWFRSAVFLNALSSIGAFSLAAMLATKNGNEHLYLASIYFFLHFQYNGWFFFACMGLLSFQLFKAGLNDKQLKKIFWLFFVSCFPAYLLSALWLNLPVWIYWIVVAGALLQLYAWVRLIIIIKPHVHQLKKNLSKFLQPVFILVAIALTIKLALQALSVIPSLSKLAFGFRPIVIGYLHLVLLGIITLFILIYIFSQQHLSLSKTGYTGLFVFIAGIIFNEVVLMVQGIGGMWYQPVSYANLLLLIAAFFLFSGTVLLNLGSANRGYALTHK